MEKTTMTEHGVPPGIPPDLPDDPGISWRPSEVDPLSGGSDSVFVDPFSETEIGSKAGIEASASSSQPPSNPLVSAYQLRHRIAEGGQGEVWQAIQVCLNRKVAVKRIRKTVYEGLDQTTARFLEASFYKEALVTGRLDHPAIVPIYDLGTDSQGQPLLAMKLVEGTEWAALIRQTRQKLDPADFLAHHIPILISVCHAVAFAHSRGIVHRDLKSRQVMVGEFGEVFLMDWGLAIVVDTGPASPTAQTMPEAGHGTGVPNPAGTICYMAPEQTEPSGNRIGPWTDVFLLGGILYNLLTGTPPWPHANSKEAFAAARTETVPPAQERAPEAFLPPELTELCRLAMAREIGERTTSVEVFRTALEQYLTGANRRGEARKIVEGVTENIRTPQSSYSELSHLDRELARARALWPENLEAAELAQQVAHQFATTALARGDLALARMQAGHLTSANGREKLLAEIDRRARQLRRTASQRRIALAACFVLITASGWLFLLFIRKEAQAQTRANQRHQAQVQSKIESDKAAANAKSAELHAELVRSLRDLHVAESELSRQFDLKWTSETLVPPLLAHNSYETEMWNNRDPKELAGLMKQFRDIRKVRTELTSAGLPLGPVPYPLLFGAATTLLYAPGQSELREAHDLFSEAAGDRPDRYRAQIGMAAALLRLGEYDAAERVMRSATRNAGETNGFRGDFGRLLALESELDRRRWAYFKLPDGAIMIEPREGGSRFEQFQVISGEWANSDKPINWAKSSAPGTTPLPGWGSRKLHFSSSFRDVVTTLPAVVRYEPRPERAGRYHVYATWPRAANAAPVHWVVNHRNGITDLPIVQDGWGFRSQANSNRWVSLGAYEFEPGRDHCLELRVEEDARPFTLLWNGQVQADAVLFSPEPLREGTIAAQPFEAGSDIKWLTEFEDARRESLRTGRQILVFSAPAGHPHTHYLDAYVFTDPAVRQALAERCVPLRVLGGGDTATAWKLRHVDNGHAWICDAEGVAVRRLNLGETLSTSTLCAAILETAQ